MTAHLRLLDACCGEVDGTAIDAPAKPPYERVLRIRVASDMYPAIRNLGPCPKVGESCAQYKKQMTPDTGQQIELRINFGD
jgi:hypothetical protein